MKYILNKIILATLLSTNALSAKEINWDNFIITHPYDKNSAGMIYFERDLKAEPYAMCKDKKEHPWRLSMIDQESQEIARLKNIPLPPSYKDISKLSIEEFGRQVENSAIALKKYCLDINLAPVADLEYSKKNPRSYSRNPQVAAQYIRSFANNMRKHNIVPTWKHFPGINNVSDSAYNSRYSKYYKNIYGEAIIDETSIEDLQRTKEVFRSNQYDILMFSIALYKNIDQRPIIFSPVIFQLAKEVQPYSLYIPDDLSELNISEEEVLWLFKHFDMLLYSYPPDTIKVKEVLKRLYQKKLITDEEIDHKIRKQNEWRQKNKLILLPIENNK